MTPTIFTEAAEEESPRRVQLSRVRGWRMPANTVMVSRPSKWGNPFKVGAWVRLGPNSNPGLPVRIRTPEQAVALFRLLCEDRTPDLSALRGKNLACWCPLPAPGEPDHCHAAVLLELANQ